MLARLGGVLLALLFWTQSAWAVDIDGVRYWVSPEKTQVVLEVDRTLKHKVFTLTNPHRVVVDIIDGRLKGKLLASDLKSTPLTKVRSYDHGDKLRITWEVSEAVRPNSYQLAPSGKRGQRLVIDLYSKKRPQKAVKTAAAQVQDKRDVVVAIDAGHGGEDPGAIGPGGLQEKKVVLAIAKELKRLIDKEKGFRAELVRTGDYYISLRKRTTKARRELRADLFISIHADAFKDPRAKGASVWVLSERGASSSMGRWLANSENASDLIGGVGDSVKLDHKDGSVREILLDMSMHSSQTYGRDIASRIHKKIAGFAKMHKRHVEKAGFLVLKSPDMPSVLVETGFISNPDEARLLRTSRYQKKMANAIYGAVKEYFWNRPPDDSLIAYQKYRGYNSGGKRTYRVERGDTLSVIASRHGVSLGDLRKENAIKGDKIRVGQVLNIPAG